MTGRALTPEQVRELDSFFSPDDVFDATVYEAFCRIRDSHELLRAKADQAERLGAVPAEDTSKAETYWQRQKLDSAIRHLRDIEDFYRTRGGLGMSRNQVRADRARAIYEQITDDYLNGKMTRPTLKEHAATLEAEVARLTAPGSVLPEGGEQG